MSVSNEFPYASLEFNRHGCQQKVLRLNRTSFILALLLIATASTARGQGLPDATQWPIFRLPPSEAIVDPVNDVIESEEIVLEELPVEDTSAEDDSNPEEVLAEIEPVPDVVWFQPTTWVLPPLWDLGFQFGLNNTAGNTETLSLQVGANAKRKTEENVFSLKLQYSKGSNNGVENENQATLNGRNEWFLGDSPWNVFTTGSLEYDQFRAFDLRLATHAGLGYQFVDSERLQLSASLGSGVSREIGGPDDRYIPEASIGGDFEWCISDSQKLSTTVDYYPEWSGFNDYRINTNSGWEIALGGPMDVSLKLAVIDRYDSTPNGRKHNDLSTALLLIWKL